MREEKKVRTKVMTRATSKQGQFYHLMRGKIILCLFHASIDFVEPLIFTNIKIIVAGLFYKRDYKTFTDFRLFFNLMFVHHML